ncbi:hypothetical protein [Persicobacter diffluens]|uniref:Uncharacterized protein n=1 Tax=Persicobacter diffluens TaxID=981 RepID=A0AAN4VYD3_9BACT|nr:hypothetical protein PEDI_17700 [Persicobacter diffluens]
MGIFSFFKKKKKDNTIQEEKSHNAFITNAGDYGFPEISLSVMGALRMDGIMAIAEFSDIAKNTGQEVNYEVMYTHLLEEGALRIPVVIDIGGKGYSLFFIYGEDDLIFYHDAKKYIGETAYPNMIYFSTFPLPSHIDSKSCLIPFQLGYLRPEEKLQPEGAYGMWWQSAEDPRFSGSVTHSVLEKLYTHTHAQGYESYLLGYILKQCGLQEGDDFHRMEYPEGSRSFLLLAPENKLVIMVISAEKGIRFLFPIRDTSKTYRERFLKGVVADLLSTRVELERAGVAKDEEGFSGNLDWFNFTCEMLEKQENGEGGVQVIGGMEFEVEA